MAGQQLYTKIPPSSTGQSIFLDAHYLLPYVGLTSPWITDEYYDLETSGIKIHVHGIYPTDNVTGWIGVHFDKQSVFNDLSPAQGERILLDGNPVASTSLTSTFEKLYTNASTIVGKNNPYNGLNVDQFGAARIRFTEGAAQLDAFGKLRINGSTPLGAYVFGNDELPQQFSTRKLGGGNLEWSNITKSIKLITDDVADSEVAHTTNIYHHYLPGSSHNWLGTLAFGDSSKIGLCREFGMFDDNDGFFFRHEDGVLSAVIRNSTSGSVVETVIPQADWNQDVADGTGPSQMNINVENINIYWIDIQWLGGGRIRYGTYYNGTRVVLHEYYHNLANPSTRTASLPIRVRQINKTFTGSSSETRVWCLAVYTESDIDVNTIGTTGTTSLTKEFTDTAGWSETEHLYLSTLSPQLNYTNGAENRSLYMPASIDVLALDMVTGQPFPVEIETYFEPMIGNLNFVKSEYLSTIEVDNQGVFYDGLLSTLKIYSNGSTNYDITKLYNNISRGVLSNYSEQGGTRTTPLSNITQASPAVATIDTNIIPIFLNREKTQVTVGGVSGMTEINGQQVYLKYISKTQAELYTDVDLTIPYDSTLHTPYTSGGFVTGLLGTRIHLTLIAKRLLQPTNPVKLFLTFNWKEINQ